MRVSVATCVSICGFGLAHAQSNDLGAYQGTIKVSGTEIDPEVSYSASIKISLPVTVDVDLNCVHSTSGPYQSNKGLMLYIGTGAPGMHYEHPLPLTDAAHLTANYMLVLDPAETNSGPIQQEWDLRLTQ